jgi:hypothetical protein
MRICFYQSAYKTPPFICVNPVYWNECSCKKPNQETISKILDGNSILTQLTVSEDFITFREL